jgi:hypothetical protein
VQRPAAAADSRCCPLENIFEVVVVVLIDPGDREAGNDPRAS